MSYSCNAVLAVLRNHQKKPNQSFLTRPASGICVDQNRSEVTAVQIVPRFFAIFERVVGTALFPVENINILEQTVKHFA